MNLKNKNVLVTGGAGFIGSHLVDKLVNLGANVSVIDNLSTGNIHNLIQVKKDISLHNIDIRAFDKIEPIIKKQDIIYHLAANADVPRGQKDPDYEFSNNVIGGFNVIKSCLNTNIQKIIFASSAAVYGEPKYIPLDENHPISPVSLYGVSKAYIESLGFAYHKSYGLPFTAIRIFNNFGIRQNHFVMYDLLKKLHNNHHSLQVLGTPNHIRDYCYVTDGANFFVKVAECEKTTGEVFNLTGENSVKISDLVKILIQVTGYQNVKVSYTGTSWPGDIVKLVGNMDKAKKIINFVPEVNLTEGILKLYNWLYPSNPGLQPV
jgi:UDP-glucose 4-epimerase